MSVKEPTQPWQEQLATLARKDSSLWQLSVVVMIFLTIGMLALTLPMVIEHRGDLLSDPKSVPQLITALMCLVTLFGAHLNTQRRELSQARDALYRQLMSEQHKTDRLLDPATRSYSPVMLESLLERMSSQATPSSPLAILRIQINDMDTIRRENGEAAIEHLTRSLAEILRSSTRGSDRICRGEEGEFVVLLPGTPLYRAAVPSERIFASVAKWNRATALLDYRMSISIALSSADGKPGVPEQLLAVSKMAFSPSEVLQHGATA